MARGITMAADPEKPPGELESATERSQSRPSSNDDSAKFKAPSNEQPGFQTSLEKADTMALSKEDDGHDDPYKHLPKNEAAVLKQQIHTADTKATIATLYRYSSTNDILIIIISIITAIASGAALPLMPVIFGNLQATFQAHDLGEGTYDDFMGEMTTLVLYFVYLSIAQFVCSTPLIHPPCHEGGTSD